MFMYKTHSNDLNLNRTVLKLNGKNATFPWYMAEDEVERAFGQFFPAVFFIGFISFSTLFSLSPSFILGSFARSVAGLFHGEQGF